MEDLQRELQFRSKSKCGIQYRPGRTYGIFAQKDILAEQSIFVDPSSFGASSSPLRCAGCCAIIHQATTRFDCCDKKSFCGDQCKKLVAASIYDEKFCQSPTSFAPSLQSKAFFKATFGTEEADQGETILCENTPEEGKAHAKLLERLLAAVTREWRQSGIQPLRCKPVNSLTSTVGNLPVHFSLERDVMWPFNILQGIGVDIFKDMEFDMWVIQTIQSRIRNNGWKEEWEGITI